MVEEGRVAMHEGGKSVVKWVTKVEGEGRGRASEGRQEVKGRQ